VNLFHLVVERPVATWMIAIAAAVFGFVSYQRLPLNLMPDLSYPSITVRTEVEGYAPQEVESQISRPIEEALATVPGLAELESRSRAGVSDVVLEFAWGADIDDAAQAVRERIQTTGLPQDADRPLILRYDPSQEPILRIGLSIDTTKEPDLTGERALFLLRELAELELKRELEAMGGVAAVRVRGGLEREIRVEARQDWMAARGVTIDQIVNTLGSENVNLPGGAIRDGDQEYLVRTLNEVRTVDEIKKLEIRRADGTRVRIADVATVGEAPKDREVVSRLDGQDAVELEVFKAADANIVRVASQIIDTLEGVEGPTPGLSKTGLKQRLPDHVQLVVLENQARFIEASIDNLRTTAFLGAFLAVAVLFAFLKDFRATAIIAAAIPLSIIATFAPMYIGGVSLNLMSLGGLALGIGMLVDNAVVVLENIQVFVERGASRREAAVRGASEVAAAVTASTLTTVSVFLPITFVEGVAGQIFGDLALAVVFSLLASLAVALLFVPMLAAMDVRLPTPATSPRLRDVSRAAQFHSIGQLRASIAGHSGLRRWLMLPWWLLRLVVRLAFELMSFVFVWCSAIGMRMLVVGLGFFRGPLAALLVYGANRFQAAYERFADRFSAWMPRALARPGLVLGAALASVVVSIPLGATLGQALIPELHQGRFTAELALPVGTPLSRTSDFTLDVEEELVKIPEIAHVHTIVGTERRADSRADEGEHTARIMVALTPGGDLESREAAVMAEVRQAVVEVAQHWEIDTPETRLRRPSLFSFDTPVEVVLYDTNLDRLRDISQRVVSRLEQDDSLTDVRSSMVAGYPEVQVHYNRDLLDRYGLDTGTIARRIRDKVLGSTATSMSRGNGRLDLVVRLAEDDRRSGDELARINVNPNITPVIPLSAVATFTDAEGPSEIRRIDQRRAVAITANVVGFDVSGQAAMVSKMMQTGTLDGVNWEMAGQSREMERSLTSLQMALGLAVFLVYVIMASTFESILHPFVILVSVPLAIVGVVAALAVFSTPVSIVVLIGSIVLAGVVVNNSIVLVDTINRIRSDGQSRLDAIAAASNLRLRPILITTTTTVLGLLPLAFGLGEGAEVQQPLALTIIAGLSSSTLLTLGVIPVVYLVLTRRLERAEGTDAEPLGEAPHPAGSGAP
jgi:HAE1 family hydrophobic/amphiphilic exporter-1